MKIGEIVLMVGQRLVLPLAIFYVLHRWIGKYPEPHPQSSNRKRELLETLGLWVITVIALSFLIFTHSQDELTAPTGALRWEFFLVTVGPYIVLPLLFVILVNRWNAKDLGFALPKLKSVTIFGIGIYALLGFLPIFIPDIEPIPAPDLYFALYSPMVAEEFFFRAIIQGKLERALGQNKAWFYSGILFGLSHITTNFFVRELDVVSGIFMLIGQISAGWVFGIIYMKTRSLLPSAVAHYLQDFRLGSIIAWLLN